MNLSLNLIVALQIIAALVMIGLVLIQHGKGADMGASFGSGASGSLFGATGSANFLSRSTAACAAVFFVCTLALAFFSNDRPGRRPAACSIGRCSVRRRPACRRPGRRRSRARPRGRRSLRRLRRFGGRRSASGFRRRRDSEVDSPLARRAVAPFARRHPTHRAQAGAGDQHLPSG